mgnify:CR=1 FL=1
MSWPITLLGDVVDVLDSQRRPITKSDRRFGPYPYYGATGVVDWVDGYLFDEPLVLIGEDGAKWGAGDQSAFSIEGKAWVNNHAHVLRPHRSDLLDDWLIYFLNAADLSEYVSGMTVPKLNQGNLRQIEVPLPPLAEQKRIVAVLDQAFAALDRARANAEANLVDAKSVFNTHVDVLFSQKEKTWNKKSLGDLADFRNGINFTKASKGSQVRVLGVKDFQDYFNAPDTGLAKVTINGELDSGDCLRNGDIVFVRSNGNPELIGRSVVVNGMSQNTVHSGFTIRARLRTQEVLPDYLGCFVKSSAVRRKMVDSGIGTNIKSLNQGALSQLLVSYPDGSEQQRVVERLKALREETRRLESICAAKLSDITALRQSLLHAAFSGQLT